MAKGWLGLGGGAIALLLVVTLGGATTAIARHHGPRSPQVPSSHRMPLPAMEGEAQALTLEAQLRVGGELLWFEVARTPEQRARGLMFRTELPRDRGMAFPFDPPRAVSFWMKNTRIPLDMIFLREGVVHHIERQVPPCTEDPCPSYGPPPSSRTDLVLELAAGRAAELGIQPGDRLTLEFPDFGVLEFVQPGAIAPTDTPPLDHHP